MGFVLNLQRMEVVSGGSAPMSAQNSTTSLVNCSATSFGCGGISCLSLTICG